MSLVALITMLVVQISVTIITARFLFLILRKNDFPNHKEGEKG